MLSIERAVASEGTQHVRKALAFHSVAVPKKS
jgi:hypothetical protein